MSVGTVVGAFLTFDDGCGGGCVDPGRRVVEPAMSGPRLVPGRQKPAIDKPPIQ